MERYGYRYRRRLRYHAVDELIVFLDAMTEARLLPGFLLRRYYLWMNFYTKKPVPLRDRL